MLYHLKEICKSGAAQVNNWTMKGINFKSESISGAACKKRLDRSLKILLPSSRLRIYASAREFTQDQKHNETSTFLGTIHATEILFCFFQADLIIIDQRSGKVIRISLDP